MRRIFIPMLFGFGTMLALVIGQRLTQDAMAVVLGVAVGVAASVPVSILLVALVRRAQRVDDSEQRPVCVVEISAPPPLQIPARRQS